MKIPAYKILVLFSEQLKNDSHERHLVAEQYKVNQLRRTKSGIKTISIDLKFTQISLDWMNGLSNSSALFLIRNVINDLKMYNLLWHWPTPKKSSEKMIIKELIGAKIIFRTETVGMYVVNPMKLWRGTIFSAVECTKKILLENKKPVPELIRDLKPSGDYMLFTEEDHFNLLNDNTPNLLEDQEEKYLPPDVINNT